MKKSLATLFVVVLSLLCSIPAHAQRQIYAEDFQSDPDYRITEDTCSNCVYWDSRNGDFYAKVHDVSQGEILDGGTSPRFQELTPDDDFTVEFDFNPVKPDWGLYPGIYFVPSAHPTELEKVKNISFSFRIQWSDKYYKKFMLAGGSHKYTSPTIPGANEWYHISLRYHAASSSMDCTIRRKSNNSVFYQETGLPFQIKNFDQIIIGSAQTPPKYGTEAVIRVDNMVIAGDGTPEPEPEPEPDPEPGPGPDGSVDDFATRFYIECLNREPDPAGLSGWSSALRNQWVTGADLARGFILSPEFISRGTSDEEFLVIMYRAFFNRQPDATGFNGWLSALQSGTSRSSVLEGFIHSGEFSALCLYYGITSHSSDLVEAFVTRFYRECLNRDPDPAGLDGWVNGLKNGSVAGGEVAETFMMSPEYLSLGTSDQEFLETLYYAFFNREPDELGLKGWLSALKNGASRYSVLMAFIHSDEFFRLCAEYGIDAVGENREDRDGDGYSEAQGDCNDSNPDVHPGALEICGDGVDQDCSGSDQACFSCADISGNWGGSWAETTCSGRTDSGTWVGYVDSDCNFFGTDSWVSVTGSVNPANKILTATGIDPFGCGHITMDGLFQGDSLSGSFRYSNGGSGSFKGKK